MMGCGMFIHTEATLLCEQPGVMQILADEPMWTSAGGGLPSLLELRLSGRRAATAAREALAGSISVLLLGRFWQASITVTVYGLPHGRSKVFLNAEAAGLATWLRPRRLRSELKRYLERVLAEAEARTSGQRTLETSSAED
jgi:hypothetical protein